MNHDINKDVPKQFKVQTLFNMFSGLLVLLLTSKRYLSKVGWDISHATYFVFATIKKKTKKNEETAIHAVYCKDSVIYIYMCWFMYNIRKSSNKSDTLNQTRTKW